MWTIDGDAEGLYFKITNGMARIWKEEWKKALEQKEVCGKCRQREDRMFDIPILGGKNATK